MKLLLGPSRVDQELSIKNLKRELEIQQGEYKEAK